LGITLQSSLSNLSEIGKEGVKVSEIITAEGDKEMSQELRDKIAEQINIHFNAYKATDSVLALPELDRLTKVCEWVKEGKTFFVYVSSCGHEVGVRFSNGKYCPFCGRTINQTKEEVK
jgi:hypothetical protein